MLTKYLPIHPRMMEGLIKGFQVMHCGNGSPRGSVGTILSWNATHVQIGYKTVQREYSRKWFVNNMYLNVEDIKRVNSFKAGSYLRKYATFEVDKHSVIAAKTYAHKAMKRIVDLAVIVKEQVAKEKASKVTNIADDGPVQDPMHKEGEFYIFNAAGKKETTRKTMAIAIQYCEQESKSFGGAYSIFQKVAEVVPVRQTETKLY